LRTARIISAAAVTRPCPPRSKISFSSQAPRSARRVPAPMAATMRACARSRMAFQLSPFSASKATPRSKSVTHLVDGAARQLLDGGGDAGERRGALRADVVAQAVPVRREHAANAVLDRVLDRPGVERVEERELSDGEAADEIVEDAAQLAGDGVAGGRSHQVGDAQCLAGRQVAEELARGVGGGEADVDLVTDAARDARPGSRAGHGAAGDVDLGRRPGVVDAADLPGVDLAAKLEVGLDLPRGRQVEGAAAERDGDRQPELELGAAGASPATGVEGPAREGGHLAFTVNSRAT
jgi:hypothetical protein